MELLLEAAGKNGQDLCFINIRVAAHWALPFFFFFFCQTRCIFLYYIAYHCCGDLKHSY